MSRTCSTSEEEGNPCKLSAWNPKRKKNTLGELGTDACGCIKMDLMVVELLNWICVAQFGNQWRGFTNLVVSDLLELVWEGGRFYSSVNCWEIFDISIPLWEIL
jgi:hypothetical protein